MNVQTKIAKPKSASDRFLKTKETSDVLGILKASTSIELKVTIPFDNRDILRSLGFDPVDVDSLCARTGLAAQQVTAELLRLELAGQVAALPGGMYQRLA